VPTRTPIRPTTTATSTPVDTATPTSTQTAIPLPTEPVTETPVIATPASTAVATVAVGPAPSVMDTWRQRPRWGIGVRGGSILRYDTGPLRLGWYLDWGVKADPARPGGAEYAQMVHPVHGGLRPDVGTIAAIAQANPGSLWLVGNEPDVKWQNNVEPATYARLYHEAYGAIKEADPTAQVAIGGVTQPTPLRMRYLEAILASYREQFGVEMPVDVWNIHNFILREERGSWGVDIPPGLPDDYGTLYEIEDNDNMDIFRQQIVNFRRWMAQRGYQDRPLIVSEYGVLMPEEYGFPPERVVAFLTATFDFFLTAADPALGYPADDYRLVQRWCWYALDAPDYTAGNLFDPQSGAMTAVGEGWKGYVAGR